MQALIDNRKYEDLSSLGFQIIEMALPTSKLSNMFLLEWMEYLINDSVEWDTDIVYILLKYLDFNDEIKIKSYQIYEAIINLARFQDKDLTVEDFIDVLTVEDLVALAKKDTFSEMLQDRNNKINPFLKLFCEYPNYSVQRFRHARVHPIFSKNDENQAHNLMYLLHHPNIFKLLKIRRLKPLLQTKLILPKLLAYPEHAIMTMKEHKFRHHITSLFFKNTENLEIIIPCIRNWKWLCLKRAKWQYRLINHIYNRFKCEWYIYLVLEPSLFIKMERMKSETSNYVVIASSHIVRIKREIILPQELTEHISQYIF